MFWTFPVEFLQRPRIVLTQNERREFVNGIQIECLRFRTSFALNNYWISLENAKTRKQRVSRASKKQIIVGKFVIFQQIAVLFCEPSSIFARSKIGQNRKILASPVQDHRYLIKLPKNGAAFTRRRQKQHFVIRKSEPYDRRANNSVSVCQPRFSATFPPKPPANFKNNCYSLMYVWFL